MCMEHGAGRCEPVSRSRPWWLFSPHPTAVNSIVALYLDVGSQFPMLFMDSPFFLFKQQFCWSTSSSFWMSWMTFRAQFLLVRIPIFWKNSRFFPDNHPVSFPQCHGTLKKFPNLVQGKWENLRDFPHKPYCPWGLKAIVSSRLWVVAFKLFWIQWVVAVNQDSSFALWHLVTTYSEYTNLDSIPITFCGCWLHAVSFESLLFSIQRMLFDAT